MPKMVSSERNMRKEPARYMSWTFSAWISIGPVVGRFITMETTAAEETSDGR